MTKRFKSRGQRKEKMIDKFKDKLWTNNNFRYFKEENQSYISKI